MRKPRLTMKWNWSWGFVLFIALPAVALALLGLRAVRAERIEREQELRGQQLQIARLVDSAISNKLGALEVELRQGKIRDRNGTDGFAYLFSLDGDGVLRFPNEGVYFGEQPTEAWPANTQQLIDDAQSATAQGRSLEALALYGRISQAEPKLSGWTTLNIASIKQSSSDTTALKTLLTSNFADSDNMTPRGVPVALIAFAYVEQVPPQEQSQFALFVERTLDNLRKGRWWLSYEQRAFYDGRLQQMLLTVQQKPLTEDRTLKDLADIEQAVRRWSRSNEKGSSFESGKTDGAGVLIASLTGEDGSSAHSGLGIPQDHLTRLLDSTLSSLLSSQPFGIEIRDLKGHRLWGDLQRGASHSEPVRSVRGLEATFSSLNKSAWMDQRQLFWFGLIVLLVALMVAGLTMTARVVRREFELRHTQNEFVAAVSHEFKSPIASIRLLMERITSGRLQTPEAINDYYTAIDREAERLERLVSRLLEWQQIQAGQRRYNFSTACLVDIARTAAAQMRPRAEAKSITLENNFDLTTAPVNTDEAALADAIENLIDNAIKYSPSGTKIVVSCATTDHHAWIEVRDQGVGIANDELPRIFDRFYRGRRGDMSNVHGTGLGLALVKATIEAHGGTVEVDSKPGLGSCFRLSLPIRNGVSSDGANPDS